MLNIITKIIAFLVSIIMAFIGFPSDGTPVETDKTEIIYNSFSGLNSDGEYVFDSYDEFLLYTTTVNRSEKMQEYAQSITPDFFENNNLAIIDITLADSAETTELISAVENGDLLTVKYHIFSTADVAAAVICYESICIVTSKQISRINSVEIITPEIFELI